MSGICSFSLSMAWLFGFSIPGFALFKRQRRRKIYWAFLGVAMVGSLAISTVGYLSRKEAVVEEARLVAAEPRKWLAGEMAGLGNASISGTLHIVDGKIAFFRRRMDRTDDRELVMLYGSAIDALESQAECLRRMRSPAKCLVD